MPPLRWIVNKRCGWEVIRTSSQSSPATDFGARSVKTSCSAARESVRLCSAAGCVDHDQLFFLSFVHRSESTYKWPPAKFATDYVSSVQARHPRKWLLELRIMQAISRLFRALHYLIL